MKSAAEDAARAFLAWARRTGLRPSVRAARKEGGFSVALLSDPGKGLTVVYDVVPAPPRPAERAWAEFVRRRCGRGPTLDRTPEYGLPRASSPEELAVCIACLAAV